MKNYKASLNKITVRIASTLKKAKTFYRNKKHCQYMKACTHKNHCVTQDPLALTPTLFEESEPAFESVKHLNEALSCKDLHNIALMGSYGSGKSSIIKTLRHNFAKNRHFLNISLASLQTKGTTKEELHQKVEYSILQQIIYKDPQKTHRSRFPKISHISKNKVCLITASIFLFAISVGILLEPEWVIVPSIRPYLQVPAHWKVVIDLISILIISFSLFLLTKYFVKSFRGFSVGKIKIANAEIEAKVQEAQSSVFNKHLDEIFYFFEATGYNVVFFEDLDRFDDPELFLKLREINQLLNESETTKKKNIRFIYAIRDDLFGHYLERTKFFDKIIAVIPHIDTSNSSEKLKALLSMEPSHPISDEVCYGLGPFLGDMRLMKNIVAEFKQYVSVLRHTEKDALKNLLGLITYKHFYPKDFALLYKGKGKLHSIFREDTKDTCLDEYINFLKAELDNATNERETTLKSLISTLRAKYIDRITVPPSGEFYINNITRTKDEITEAEQLFKQVIEDNLYIKIPRYTETRATPPFAEIEKIVDPNKSYKELYQECLSAPEIERAESDIEQIEQQINDSRTLKLGDLYVNFQAPTLHSLIGDKQLVAYLISSKVIDDSYYRYISYFYEGRLTTNDNDFIKSVLRQIQPPFTYRINDPAEVVNHLIKSKHYAQNILNFDILNYVYTAQIESHQSLFFDYKKHIRTGKKYEFIRQYYNSTHQSKQSILQDIFLGWSEITRLWDEKWDKTQKDEYIEILLLHYSPSTAYIVPASLGQALEDSFWVCGEKLSKVGTDRMVDFCCNKFGVRFSSINSMLEDMFELVVQNNLYEINEANILSILRYEGVSTDQYNNAALTTILTSKNEPFKSYITKFLYRGIPIFPQTSTNESIDAITAIINNPNLTPEWIVKYLSRQANKISSLNDITEYHHELIINNDLITPSWNVIYDKAYYIDTPPDGKLLVSTDSLVEYIGRNIDALPLCVGEEIEPYLFNHILGTNVIKNVSVYKKLCRKFSSVFKTEDLSKLDPAYMIVLISEHKIEYNPHFHKLIEDHFLALMPSYIIANIKEYVTNPNVINIEPTVLLELLQSSKVNKNQRTAIINQITPNLLYADTNIANEVCQQINQIGLASITLDLDTLVEVLKISANQESRQKCVVEILKAQPFSQDNTSKLLTALGGQYAKTPQREQAKWPLNEYSRYIANYIFQNNYEHITSEPREETNGIRVYTKKK